MKASLQSALLLLAFSLAASLYADTRVSANYAITTETIDSAGLNAQSANYALHGSAAGEFAAGSAAIITSANYTDKLGYVGQLSDMLDPITAGSQLAHGSAGTFNIALPLLGTPGVECRLGPGRSYTVVFTFGNPLSSVGGVSASATGGGPAPGATGSIDGNDAHRYIVNLTNVPNAQYTTVALSNVMDLDANFAASVQTTMGVLLGDVNATGGVDGNDVSAVQSHTRQQVNSSTFRYDVNITGSIDGNDVSLVQSSTRTHLP